jgi:hypothetical protein
MQVANVSGRRSWRRARRARYVGVVYILLINKCVVLRKYRFAYLEAMEGQIVNWRPCRWVKQIIKRMLPELTADESWPPLSLATSSFFLTANM